MKKGFVSIMVMASMFVLSGMRMSSLSAAGTGTPANDSKMKQLVLTNYLSAKLLDGVKRSKKKIDNGVLVTLKTKKADRLDLLGRLFDAVRKESEKLESAAGHENEILYWKEVKWTATKSEKELKIEILTDNPELVKKIRKVYLPPAVFRSNFKAGDQTGDMDDYE